MAPKKANGYFLFMLSLQQQYRADCGRDLPMAQMQFLASSIWQSLSAEEKKLYKDQGRYLRNSEHYEALLELIRNRDNGQNTQSSFISEPIVIWSTPSITIGADLEKLGRVREKYRKDTPGHISWLHGDFPGDGSLLDRRFYVASSQYLYEYQNAFPPVEIALVGFTLRDGVFTSEHYVIDAHFAPSEIEMQAKIHSLNSHNLYPLPPHMIEHINNGSQATGSLGVYNGSLTHNWGDIWYNVWQKCCDEVENDIGHVLCMAKEFSVVEYAIYYMKLKGEQLQNAEIRRQMKTKTIQSSTLVCIEDFIFSLHEYGNRRRDLVTIEEQMQSHANQYLATVQTNCAFHQAQANENCALGTARRACFGMVEIISSVFQQIRTVPGKHVPLHKVPVPQTLPPQSLSVTTHRPQVLCATPIVSATASAQNPNVSSSAGAFHEPLARFLTASRGRPAVSNDNRQMQMPLNVALPVSSNKERSAVAHSTQSALPQAPTVVSFYPMLPNANMEQMPTEVQPWSAPHNSGCSVVLPEFQRMQLIGASASVARQSVVGVGIPPAPTPVGTNDFSNVSVVSASGAASKPLRKPKSLPSSRLAARLHSIPVSDNSIQCSTAMSSAHHVSNNNSLHQNNPVAAPGAISYSQAVPNYPFGGPATLGLGRASMLPHLLLQRPSIAPGAGVSPAANHF